MHLPNAQNIQSMYAHNEGPHHKPIDEWLILNFNLPRMLTNPPSTICPRSQGMHTLLVSTVTHTHKHWHLINPWSAAVDSDWPTNPTRFSEIGNTRLHSLTHRPPHPSTHGPVSEWSAPRHFTRGVLALSQSEGFVGPFWGFSMGLVIRWYSSFDRLWGIKALQNPSN